MKNQIKKIKATTVENYSAQRVWTAVLRRSDSYRYEFDGIYIDCGDHFRFHCSHHDYHRAAQAIIGIGAVEFNGKFSLLEHM
jgi:hypothetical protein